jgi:hypothetical protein
MFTDVLRDDTQKVQAIAIVRVNDEHREKEDIQASLWMLERDARIVNWLEPGARAAFLQEREQTAQGTQ